MSSYSVFRHFASTPSLPSEEDARGHFTAAFIALRIPSAYELENNDVLVGHDRDFRRFVGRCREYAFNSSAKPA
jgi:hypothetical protein